MTPSDVLDRLQGHVRPWSQRMSTRDRLVAFGIPKDALPALLRTYAKALADGTAFRPEEQDAEVLARLAHDVFDTNPQLAIDRALTTTLYNWACDPRHSSAVLQCVSKPTLQAMMRLRDALDFTRIIDRYPLARAMQRKIIMHVGPTNSGKTHNALRTLAAAKVGAYAGPLRLLAHEIFERLNSGQIVPLGVDPDATAEPDEGSNIDALDPSDAKAISKHGNARFARPCNLITGEERRTMANATLYSCTVEMLQLDRRYDVVVVDEIQLIADSDRGFAWTSAVIGAAASELHLCGEETAVPLVESLAAMTGDEVIVNRYQRLSELKVADESLNNDFKRVQKGDCIVAFSRSRIFQLRDEVQKSTGLRCAVAYGRLPPEIRSEQAALFNDRDSGYDVMVGSDAIGMGLNLKIKRVIFESMEKFNGGSSAPLSYSQVKQIAGRAGRYGMHADAKEGGIVTTLSPADLPLLREAMAAPIVPLRHARIGFFGNVALNVIEALPKGTSLHVIRDALIYGSTLPPTLAIMDPSLSETTTSMFVDSIVHPMSFYERVIFMIAPFPIRDELCKSTVGKMFELYRDRGRVDIAELLRECGLLNSLNHVLHARQHRQPLAKAKKHLEELETLHKCLVTYIWLYMHFPVGFYAHEQARALTRSTEEAMDYALQQGRQQERGPQRPRLEVLKSKNGMMARQHL
ncbi:P-loop containing nucleoside triphosphate hydrolase protein [Auriscalpium vulgare]|uniref:P-loop containing nucleoside triphosphate hydrolase protein n=1 Tax=Auriscalpium vulgare TaxID=40419 RepID=A0ACB8RNF7_9AGAM|nr:P-loop containing nucleoside triphosphate hydrolase protein [Auriscalpium vulgare]